MGCLQLTYQPKKSSPLKVSWNRNAVENPSKGVEKYLYQGKELQTELGLDIYSFEIRNYDHVLGRWLQIDPKVSPHETPYSAMSNNPIRYIDPLGDTVRDQSGDFAKYRAYVSERVSALQGVLNDKNFDYSALGITKEQVSEALNMFSSISGELTSLEESEQIYNVDRMSIFESISNSGGTSYDPNTGEINVTLSASADMGLVGHEMLHAYQYETGKISFASDNSRFGVLYDITDETAGYKRGAFIRNPFNVGNITDNTVRGLHPDYKNLPDGPLDINSSVGLQMRLRTIREGAFNYPNSEVYKGYQGYYKKLFK
jgi:RHS repeat-associated protein